MGLIPAHITLPSCDALIAKIVLITGLLNRSLPGRDPSLVQSTLTCSTVSDCLKRRS